MNPNTPKDNKNKGAVSSHLSVKKPKMNPDAIIAVNILPTPNKSGEIIGDLDKREPSKTRGEYSHRAPASQVIFWYSASIPRRKPR